MADVTVVVPSFEQGRFLDRCIASVRGQIDVDVELIVVDACSADTTAHVLERWRSDIDLLIVEPDGGQADAIAKGFERSSTPIMTWLNADDAYAGPVALRTLLTWLARRPDKDLVYGRRAWIDGAGGFLRLDRWQPFDEPAFRLACYLPQECAVFRREAYDRAGGLDRSFSFALDYDLWLRMLDAGSSFLSVPTVVGLFRVHAGQKTTAAWEDVGLVEIGRLHRRHLGRPVPEPEILATAEDHRNGTRRDAPLGARRLNSDLAAILNGALAAKLRGRALDRWALAETDSPLDRPAGGALV